jgi:putative phage-type endonuclease
MDKIIEFKNKEEWLAYRKQGVGGSDVGAIMGISPYRSALQVYLDKIEDTTTEDLFLIPDDNPKTKMGHIMEPVIASLFTEETGKEIMRYDNKIFINEKFPLFLGSFDGIVYEDGKEIAVLECKNVGGFGTKLWSDGVPLYYQAQVQHYMLVADLPLAYVAVLIDGWDFQIYEVSRDDAFISAMIRNVEYFWEEHVKAKLPPTPKTAEDIKAMFASATPDKLKTCNNERLNDIVYLQEVQSELRKLKTAEEQLKTGLQAYMEDAEVLADEDGKVLITWKNTKPSKTFDSKRFQQEHPELYQQYLKESAGIRKFLIKI